MKLWSTLILCLLLTGVWAQESETLIDDIDIIGAFGGPIVEFGSINGEFGMDVGGGGALVINNFFLGGYGMGTDYPEINIDDVEYNIRFRHGGFWLGYTTNPDRLAHFYSSMRLGWGRAQLRGDGPNEVSDRLFAVTPEIGVEINLTRFMRIAITGGYRAVTGISKLPGLDNGDFASPIGGLTFRFGGFSSDWGDFDWDW